MRGPIVAVTRHRRVLLTSGWEFCSAAPDSVTHPDGLSAASLTWIATSVPTTVAGSLRAAGRWTLDGPPRRFDAEDWWYRCRFAAPAAAPGTKIVLGFDGLATVADVWLNGTELLSSDNMFVAHEIHVDDRLRADNELIIRFRSLDQLLRVKRPRPRWRAPMIENQQLRWFRTTVLGRTPGWSPPAACVGPWQPVWIEQRRDIDLADATLRARVENDRGIVEFSATLELLGAARLTHARLCIQRDEQRVCGDLAFDAQSRRLRGSVVVENPALWWPHTHGTPATYSVRALLTLNDPPGAAECEVALGQTGFRSVALETSDDGFALRVNGVRIFCRGACWTPLDVVTLRADRAAHAAALEQVRAAGMNMLRVGGTMVYEGSEFLDQCDAAGILVWQDFMFANMDYPAEDQCFASGVVAEIAQQLARLSAHPCVALLCGNSEVEQQAAMFGASRERWSPALFHETLPRLVAEHGGACPYWPSSAHGGAFPHQVSSGSTSYYGVGAYFRSLEDARLSEVKFASECLAFANVPEDETLAAMPNGLAVKVHHPEWKARSPRDLGAGWDFDDVRDFYVARLFDVDPLQLRYADHDRYLQLGRVAVGEVMAACFAQWRRRRSACNGALLWFLRDLWPGAGWGIVDACGRPKAPYYHLRRALQPTALALTDEGCNGLMLHVVNDTPKPLRGTLTLTLYRAGHIVVATGSGSVDVAPHAAGEIPAASLFEGFYDLSYAFRFGPPSYDVALAALTAVDGHELDRAWHFPVRSAVARSTDVGLSASAHTADDGTHRLAVRALRFADSVSVRADGYACSDQYFHLAPNSERILELRPVAGGARRPLRGFVLALNASTPAPIET